MLNNNKEILLNTLFSLLVVANIVGVLLNETVVTPVLTPLIFAFLLILYVGLAKKTDKYFIAHLILILIAEILIVIDDKFLFYAVFTSIIAQILLVKLIIGFKHLRYRDAIIYFLVTFIGYIVIYFYVLGVKTDTIIILYGLVNSLVTALSLVNYLRKMYMANYLLFLGVAFWVLNNAIVSLNIFDTNGNVLGLITNIITHFFICRSFIVRTNRLPKRLR